MKKASILTWLFLLFFAGRVFAGEKVMIKFFHSPNCKHCINIKENFLPQVISKYKDKIEIQYFDITGKENFKIYLALEKEFNIDAKIPFILIGNRYLNGSKQIIGELETLIDENLKNQKQAEIKIKEISLLEKFHSFSPLAVFFAGLIDGINPCAFTVLIFFISFLTLMGYKRRELAVIGISFIFAVFLTYLAIGLGLFKGLYELKGFYTLLKTAYYLLAGLCFILAYFNLRDFFSYIRTKDIESLKVKLPKPIRSRIDAIITNFYRKNPQQKWNGLANLILGTFVVGFLVSLLEAICTGQVYLPTIVFILKEPSLRIKAVFYLLLYNFMFVMPLLIILLFALLGTSSQRFQEFFRKKIALIKILMFILFLGLGIFLLLEI